MESKQGIVKPLLITVLFTVIVIEFLFLLAFYDLDFNFIIYTPGSVSQISSSFPIYESPAILIMLKHKYFLARVEVCISYVGNEIRLSFSNGTVVNLTGEGEYVFTTVLPGEFPLFASISTYCVNGHYISMNRPVEVFLEEARLIHRYEGESNAVILANINVISGSAMVKVKVWGIML